MADAWDALLAMPKAAEGYAQGQLETDPWSFASKGIGAAKYQFDNPWAQIAAQALQGLGVGATSQMAQNNYNENLSNAYTQMLSGLSSGQKLEDPEMQNALEPVRALYNVGLSRENYENKKQLAQEERQLAKQKDLIRFQEGFRDRGGNAEKEIIKSLFSQYLQDMSSPEAKAARSVGLPQESFAGEILKKQLGMQSAGGLIPSMIPQGESPPAEDPAKERLKKALVARGGDLKAANELLESEDKARTEVAKELFALKKHEGMITDLENVIKTAGQTGGVVFPELRQKLRESVLKLKAQEGDPEATKRIMAMQDLASMALETVAEIRRDFPGSVTEKEMEWYFAAAANPDKTPAQNRAIAARLRRLYERVEQDVSVKQKLLSMGGSLFDVAENASTALSAPSPSPTPPVRFKASDLVSQGYRQTPQGWTRDEPTS